ncbi:MAG: hypothetical protein L3K18_04820 [Thermoplasmata archaeon]|nr:hypothetical protein [Thermoplasmata archaeon]
MTFDQVGLSSFTLWRLTFNGTNVSTANNTTSFEVPNGTYLYEVGAVRGFTAYPTNGSVVVNGTTWLVFIIFASTPPPPPPELFTVNFSEDALPMGTPWTVTFNGTQHGSSTRTIGFRVPNGTYFYTVGDVAGYNSDRPYGIQVSGRNLSEFVDFTKIPVAAVLPPRFWVDFNATGLPPRTVWSLEWNGSVSPTSDASLTFLVPNATYRYVVEAPSGFNVSPTSGNVTVAGGAVGVGLHFAAIAGPPATRTNASPIPLWFTVAPVGILAAVALAVAGVWVYRRGPRK